MSLGCDSNTNECLSDIKKKLHPPNVVLYIRFAYITGIIIWILILHYLNLCKSDVYIIAILAIPFICFILGYINAPNITGDMESEIFNANYLSVGLLLVVPLLTCINRDFGGDKKYFTKILILSIITSLLSMLDIWVPDSYFPVVKHVQSIFQTYTISLLIYGLYSFYSESPNHILN